jgi:hypothetical protein
MNTDIKEIDLSYWAGFMDGESSIKLYKGPKKNSIGKVYDCYTPKIEVTNTDILLIEQMIKTFQIGYIYLDKPRKTATGKECKPIARWIVTYQNAYKVAKIIFPYLREINKKRVAEEIINYYETRIGKPRIK